MQRMTWASFLETIRKAAPFFEELARQDVIGAALIDGRLAIRTSCDQLSPTARRRWDAAQPLTTRDYLNYWLQTQVVVGGPKVFRPTLEQCLAMEQVAPWIAIADYAQPFPVMVLELAEAYQNLRICSLQSAGGIPSHAPSFVLIGSYGSPPWTIWLDLVWDSGIGLQWALLPTDATIEDGIVREFGAASLVPAPSVSAERLVIAGLLRLAVNAMLLLTEFGCKHLGPANEAHYRRLERYAALARKRRRGDAEPQRNLRLATQLYGFPQEIVLHGEERTSADPQARGGEEDAHRRPHWRRGHWKMQACGPGLSQHKRLFIKPVLVNRELLRDGEGIPLTNYRVRD